jgi:multidrug resistance efflux pump
MNQTFARCFRTLGRDSSRFSRIGVTIALITLVVWGGWAVSANVQVLAVSADARLEAVSASQPISAPVAGRVTESLLFVGRAIAIGDLLVVLDHRSQTLELDEIETVSDALSARLAAARNEVLAYEQSLSDGLGAARAAVEEAGALKRAADVKARFDLEIADFYEDLNESGHAARIEMIRIAADAAQSGAEADATRLAIERLEWDWQRQNSDTRAELEHARSVVAELEGAVVTNAAASDRVRYEIDRRHIRSHTSGRIGQVSDVRVGMVVNAGDRMGDIVPEENLHIVARFAPADALGRIQPGQQARMRLHGFPWTQYGTAVATVASVGSELCEGMIRVELSVLALPDIPNPTTHGLPGTVEIEVERVSPATLMLRSTGYFLGDVESNATLATIGAE